MIKLLPVHLINPATDRVMCVYKRKNVNYTDEPLHMTCKKCIDHYNRNVEWWAAKRPQEAFYLSEIDWDIDANLPMYTRDYLRMEKNGTLSSSEESR